jgi:hypothetical protein
LRELVVSLLEDEGLTTMLLKQYRADPTPIRQARMTYRIKSALLAVMAIALLGPTAKADAPKEIRTEKNKPVGLANFLSAPSNCGTNPGPVPLPRLREKPSKGVVGLQIVVTDVAASDSCPARKMPAIALFYTPNRDFVGADSVQVELETSDNKTPTLSFLIKVDATAGK